MTGCIKEGLQLKRGYGFIAAEDGNHYFFHLSDCSQPGVFQTLAIGDRVIFTPTLHDKGPRATFVSRDEAPHAA